MLEAERRKIRARYAMKSALASVAILVALACAVSVFLLPVVQIKGGTMAPTLKEGDIVLAPRMGSPKNGDLLAFYSGNRLLVKRAVAGPGEWIDIDSTGSVTVNGSYIDEPYAYKKTRDAGDIELPVQIPDERWFVLGDDRTASVDSRYAAVGMVSKSDILGRPMFRVWPLDRFGPIS